MNVAVVLLALMVTLDGGEPLMKSPFWLTFTFTFIEVVGAGFAVTVTVVVPPSVMVVGLAEMVTDGVGGGGGDPPSLSSTMTVAMDGSPTS